MRHARPGLEGECPLAPGKSGGQHAGIVIQRLLGTHLDQHRWQAREVAKDRREQGVVRFFLAGVGFHPAQQILTAHDGIPLGTLLVSRPGKRQVGPGAQAYGSTRHGNILLAQRQQRGHGETTACRITQDGDLLGLEARGEQALVGGHGIIQRARKGIFRGAPVVHQEARAAGCSRQSVDQLLVAQDGTQGITTPMEIQEGSCALGAGCFDPGTGHTPFPCFAQGTVFREGKHHRQAVIDLAKGLDPIRTFRYATLHLSHQRLEIFNTHLPPSILGEVPQSTARQCLP